MSVGSTGFFGCLKPFFQVCGRIDVTIARNQDEDTDSK